MLVSPTDPGLYLLDPEDVKNVKENLPSDPGKMYRNHLEQVVDWVHTYLCQPHPALGREGPVCPYTEPSLKRGLFWLTVYPGADPVLADVSAAVTRYREWFLKLEPVGEKEAEHKAILIVFPELSPARAPGVIDVIQTALKHEFVAAGLMIGQFHAGCDEPALWNRDFRSLRSPVPLLAIRCMVRTDAAFLTQDAGSLAAYLRWFGHDVPSKLQPLVRAAALRFGLEAPGT